MKKIVTLLLILTASFSYSQDARVIRIASVSASVTPIINSSSSAPFHEAEQQQLRSSDALLSSFPNMGWASKPAFTGGRWGTGPAFTKPCVSGTDTGYVYLIGGYDGAFANTTTTSAYNITTGVWTNKAALPATRGQCTPLQVKEKIYVIAGYGASSFSPVTTNSIYDVTTNTWTIGAPIPVAVGDYASGVYNDSLIYIIGGYSGSADVNLVQVYNISTNTWSTATSKIGTAVAGVRAAITGNKIVLVGGYSQILAVEVADAYMGVIDPANASLISWSALPAYPGGAAGRHAAGILAEANGLVYFAGGDPSGAGTAANNQVYAYNTNLNEWEIGPSMISSASNISSLAGVVEKDTLYLVTMGGYDGSLVTSVNEWLKIGPASQQPAAMGTATICAGTPTLLTASSGVSYSWSPAGSLSNASIATPLASPPTTTTYTVNITTSTGCVVSKNVTITVNPLPIADAGSSATICAGNSTMLMATGGTSYSWLPAGSLSNSAIDMPTASPSITTTFTVSVTDGNGCVSSDNVLVTVNALPIANAGSSASICLGNSTMLSATGGTSYSWLPITDLDNSLIDMPTASPLVATTYSVTVTDGNGCSASASVLVTVNDLPVSSLTSTNISCNGLTNGTGSVSVSGTSTYSYLWSTSNTTSSVSGLTAGPYSVIVTDNITSCTSTSSFTISEPSAVTLSATSDTTGICNGSVTVIPSGGTPAYTYLWNDPSAQTIATPINLCPGSYTVQVTDANGCIATTTTTIYFITSVLDANNNAFSAFPNPFMDKITIENQKGTESFELINAIGQIVWSGKNIEQHNFSDLTKGVYMMRVLDGNSTQIFKLIKE